MGVVQTKEAGSAAAASTPTVAAATSDAPTAPVPPPQTPPPSAAVLDDLELSDLTKPDGDATADASGVDPVADWVRGSDEGGAEGDGEDEGDRAESLEEGGKEEAVRVEKGERKAKVRPLYPRRPGQPDCTFYVESGYCKFKAYCKFDHPPNRRKGRKGQYNKQPAADQMDAERNSNMKEGDKRIKYPQRPDATDCTFYTKTGTCNFGSACRFNHPPDRKMNKTDSERNSNMKEGDKRIKYPQRPDATDCTFYTKTGTCKFGSACRFNHPPDRKMNKAKVEKQSAHIQVGERKQQTPKQSITLKNNIDVNEESKKASTKNFGQKGKDNTTTRACMFEISKHSNQVGVKEAPSVALNFLNLPIRPGAKECPQYMSEGSCKFGINCKHHHPDPTAMNEQDLLSRNQDGQCIQQFGSGQSPSSGTPWHVSTSYTAGMYLPYGLYPNPECNGYQVPMLQPEMHTQNPSASPVNFVDNKTNALMHQQAHVEYPERPGQPECQYFKKTGICKFRSACKFHHPRNHLAKNSNSNSEPR